MNHLREGMIPTILGSAVTAAGYAMSRNNAVSKTVANTVLGFGLAHVVLGAIDLFEHRGEM